MTPKPNSTLEFDALGTHWWIESLSDKPLTPSLKKSILQRVSEFEIDYSRFRDDSLLTELNDNGELHNPPEEMVAMLRFAREMFETTEGAFNISVGGTLRGLGYGKTGSAGHADTTFWQSSTIEREYIRIPKGVILDFGGFGKGWLIDSLYALLNKKGHVSVLINGGGDIYVHAPEKIEFALEHPYDTSKQIGTTRIQHGSLAVSSTAKRTWKTAHANAHHIIEPNSDSPSESGVINTFVRADTALIADVMATVLIVRPELEQQLAGQFGLKTILLREDI